MGGILTRVSGEGRLSSLIVELEGVDALALIVEVISQVHFYKTIKL